MAARMKINVATPSYEDSYSGHYVSSFYHLIYSLLREQIILSHTGVDYADIVASRNYLLTNFSYGKTDCSHILFVDNDMGFPPELVHDMLELDQDVTGAFIPSRHIDLKYLHKSKEDFDTALRKSFRFVGERHPSGETSGKFLRMTRCGTGIMLISRKAVTKMIETMPEIAQPPKACQLPYPMPHPQFLTPFDKVEVDGRQLSEDFSFCHRWTEGCGGKIWGAPHHKISHAGRFVFEGTAVPRAD